MMKSQCSSSPAFLFISSHLLFPSLKPGWPAHGKACDRISSAVCLPACGGKWFIFASAPATTALNWTVHRTAALQVCSLWVALLVKHQYTHKKNKAWTSKWKYDDNWVILFYQSSLPLLWVFPILSVFTSDNYDNVFFFIPWKFANNLRYLWLWLFLTPFKFSFLPQLTNLWLALTSCVHFIWICR